MSHGTCSCTCGQCADPPYHLIFLQPYQHFENSYEYYRTSTKSHEHQGSCQSCCQRSKWMHVQYREIRVIGGCSVLYRSAHCALLQTISRLRGDMHTCGNLYCCKLSAQPGLGQFVGPRKLLGRHGAWSCSRRRQRTELSAIIYSLFSVLLLLLDYYVPLLLLQ